MNRQQVLSTIYNYRKEINEVSAMINHATSDFDDVMSFFTNSEIEYNYGFSSKTLDLIVNVFTNNYQVIVEAIRKHRPRLTVERVRVFNDCCVFYINYNSSWEEQPQSTKTKIESTEYSCVNWMKQSVEEYTV